MKTNFLILNIGNKVAGVSASGEAYSFTQVTLDLKDNSGTIFTTVPTENLEGLSVGDEVTANLRFKLKASPSGNVFTSVQAYNLSKVQQYEQ